MGTHNIALRYAKALLALGQTEEQCQEYLKQLRQVQSFLKKEPEAENLLNSKRIHSQIKKDLLKTLFENRLDKTLLNFLLLLQDKERMGYFSAIVEVFEGQIHEEFGYLKVKVSSALEISPQEEEEILLGLEALTGKKIILEKGLDKDQIGGLIIKIGDMVYDGSIKGQLNQLARKMKK